MTENFIQETIVVVFLVFYSICLFRSYNKGIKVSSLVDSNEIDMIVKNTSASISIGNDDAKQLESEKDLEICKKCDKFRFKRAHHCSVCKACVDKMDHHCFILNNCIGLKNYNYFISYLFLVTELSLFILILCSLNIVFFMRDASRVLKYILFFY